ncbi:alpha-E domain-containing protein [Pokkaliibacter sp. CJK22405]|uniref:alpha-E domain-containing protein n=1 Tax=Pokkaliibacter sp. CJK22405 TaxID=3384615 RepID=UPI003984B058
MLARVAENVYWMGRYLERIDDTARLINATTNMLIDTHKESLFSWPVLINVLGEDNRRFISESGSSERAVMNYLIAASDSPASIRYSCTQVRHNARCVREVIPRDIWEEVNSLNQFMQAECVQASSRRTRYNLMVEVIRRCQMVIGVMDGTMLRDDTYRLFNIGRYLERADMTTRIMDVLILQQLTPAAGLKGRRTFKWKSVLNALGGIESYQRYFAQEDGDEADVVSFLLSYQAFPRSIVYCLDKMQNEAKLLPRADSVLKTIAKLREELESQPMSQLSTHDLHRLIDDLQAGLIDIHTALISDSLTTPE